MAATARLLLLATGDHAIATAESLADAGHEIVCIVSRDNAPQGEELLPEQLQGERLADWAAERNIEVRSPRDPQDAVFRDGLASLEPEVGVVVGYGLPFPPALLELPQRGWIKIHFSQLPRYRGLFPIRAVLWNGEKKTGVSAIEVVDDADTGPILEQEAVDIDPKESYEQLAERLSGIGAELARKVVATAARGKKVKGKQQVEKQASKTPVFSPRHLTAPWWKEANLVYDRLRALTPEPGMTTMIRRRRVRILSGSRTDWVQAPLGDTGTFLGVRSGRLAVLCGGGTVFGISRVSCGEGEKPMSGSDFARAEGLKAGDLFI